MSKDFYIICHHCKTSIKIAHRMLSGFNVDIIHDKCNKAFKYFLEIHQDMQYHEMSFVDEDDSRSHEYKQIEWGV